MALTPLDIYNKEFKKATFGGISKDEVDDFLDEVMHEMEALLKDNASLKEQVAGTNLKLEHYRSLEDALNRTLVVAQATADDIKSNARREADLIIQEARMQAERVVDAGHSKSRRMIEQHGDMLQVVDSLRGQLRAIARDLVRTAESLPEQVRELASAAVELAYTPRAYVAPGTSQSYAEAAPGLHEDVLGDRIAETPADEDEFPPVRRNPPAWDQE